MAADDQNKARPAGVNPVLADLQTLKGELEVQLHLGSMDAKDKWKELKARFVEFEHQVAVDSDKLMDELADRADDLMAEFKAFRDKLESR